MSIFAAKTSFYFFPGMVFSLLTIYSYPYNPLLHNHQFYFRVACSLAIA
nr:MAG TPA: hypothetical protein [Caudoviricetes sp.]